LSSADVKIATIVRMAWCLVSIPAAVARADTPPDAAPPTAPPAEESDREASRSKLRQLTERGAYFDFFGTAMFGDGLRFDNPYRLSHQFGATGQSLSSTAPYMDLAIAATTGPPEGLQHGARLGWTVSVNGVPQQVITPSYLALRRLGASFIVYGWAGLPILLEPDANVGGELAVGGSWLARAGLGAAFALVADGFYGAGTRDTRAAFYPVVSAQLGIFVAYEVLP
jgi:hypothetical protein